MTVQETRSYIGDTIDFTYFNGSDYVDSVATYDTTVSFTSEYSTHPVGYVISQGNIWLRYTFTHYDINSNNNYITFSARPRYSIFDTEYLYTAFAVRSTSSISVSAYQSPQSNWYIGGTGVHFENGNAFSSSSTGIYASIGYSGLTGYCPYVPIMHSQNSTFSAYSIDATFYGSIAGNVGYFYVMCPYVSGDAGGASGTFVTNSGGSGDINVNVDVDLTETNGLLESILDGLNPVSQLVDLLTSAADIPEATTIASLSLPNDNADYDRMLMTMDEIMDDMPDTVAAAGFWVELTNAIFPENSWFRLIMPVLMIMALMTYVLWKK